MMALSGSRRKAEPTASETAEGNQAQTTVIAGLVGLGSGLDLTLHAHAAMAQNWVNAQNPPALESRRISWFMSAQQFTTVRPAENEAGADSSLRN